MQYDKRDIDCYVVSGGQTTILKLRKTEMSHILRPTVVGICLVVPSDYTTTWGYRKTGEQPYS